MSVVSVGIQIIMPKTGTNSQQPPQPADDRVADKTPAAPQQAPPPPGMGRLVDKTV